MLPIKFGFDQISRKQTVADLSIRQTSKIQRLTYKPTVESDQVSLAFIQMPEITPRNIHLVDVNEISQSVFVAENSYIERYERYTESTVFDLPTREALITDVYNTTSSGEKIPLYWKHKIDNGLNTSLPIIYDLDENKVSPQRYKIVVENNTISVYHNLKTFFDENESKVEAYNISYTDSLGIQHFKLLESSNAFQAANILDEENQGQKFYVSRSIGIGFQYRILGNLSGPFFIRIEKENQIKIKKPTVIHSDKPWNILVPNSSIKNNGFSYDVVEYSQQNFNDTEPLKFTGTQEAKVIGPSLVKLPVENIIEEYPLDILVVNREGNPLYGFSTGSEKTWTGRLSGLGSSNRSVKMYLRNLESLGGSVSRSAGLVSLPIILESTDRVFIRCKYKTNYFQYTELNLNPVYYQKILNSKAVIYCIPLNRLEEDGLAIRHLILDENDSIIDWNDPRLGENGILINDLIPGTKTGWERFLEEFPEFLVLGILSISKNSSLKDLTFIDSRIQGDCLTERVKAQAPSIFQTYPELQWELHKDFFGRSIPLNGVISIEAPFEVLDIAGGELTEEEATAIITRNMALGSRPIIEFTHKKPEIVNLVFNSDTEILELIFKGDKEFKYRLYYGNQEILTSIDLDYTLDGSFLKSEVSLPGLEQTGQDSVYFLIAPVKNNIEWPYSDSVLLDLKAAGSSELITLSANLVSPPSLGITLNGNIV